MSQDIDQAFIKQFEAEVHLAYQRQGSKLRNTVRTKNGVRGESTTFQKVGKGTAGQKTRHGKVPVMNLDHTPVECFLSDWYAGDWVDKLDELKINIDERQVQAQSGAFALGRKTDDMIINDALANTTNTIAVGATGMTRAKVLEAIENLGNREVPMDDGGLTGVVGWQQWTELMTISEFADADFIGESDLPWAGRGMRAKFWVGALWMPHSGLPLATNDRSCFLYHKTAVGHAIGQDVTSDITWHGDYAAHFVNNMMSMGSVLIDANGVEEIVCLES